jgi:hypothetical protein
LNRFEHISVVIHGPISSTPERNMPFGITQLSIQSVREHLPGAKVILSTWEGGDVDSLDIDEVVMSEDPGANIVAYSYDEQALTENNNRQIVAVREGLKTVTTPYAVKLRTDSYLLHSGFVGLQKAFPKRSELFNLLEERVVVAHRFTLMQSNGYPITRHLSDFFAYGLTTDLIKMWDIPLIENITLEQHNKLYNSKNFPKRFISVEQKYCSSWINKLLPNSHVLKQYYDASDESIHEWLSILSNNIIVGEANNIGLRLLPRLKGERKKSTEVSFSEWQYYYSTFCDPDYIFPKYQRWLDGFLYRKLKVPTDKLKFRLSIINGQHL